MRYTRIDLQCQDILWFGVDLSGQIAAFTSAGCGNIPEFVCRSIEETDTLSDFFMSKMSERTSGDIIGDYDTESEMYKDCTLLISKGIFCFDISGTDSSTYEKVAQPLHKANISDLPTNIQSILCDHIIDGSFDSLSVIKVKHAY